MIFDFRLGFGDSTHSYVTNNLISDLDNFSGQARQILQEILNGVRDGEIEAKTVPIEDEDQDGTAGIEVTNQKKPSRWQHVDEEAILCGDYRQDM